MQQKVKLPELYYDSKTGAFWIKNSRGHWIDLGDSGARREIKMLGMMGPSEVNPTMSLVEETMSRITKERDVEFAGPLAGFEPGIYELCGHRVLVTRGTRPVEPAKEWKMGDFPTIETLLDQQFGEQLNHVLAWLKLAVQAMASKSFAPGHLLVLAGPPGCGKSFLQNIITEILGGRSAKPYRYMVGNSQFNSDLFEAEHLMIEDDAASTDYRMRRQFGSVLKQFLHNQTHSYHAKGRPAMTLPCFWRLSISVNEEPENLMVLPPLDEDLAGKILLLKVGVPDCLPDMSDSDKAKAFRANITKELPAFLAWLKAWRIPKKMRRTKTAGRFGFDAYQHPELVEALTSMAPHHRLLGLIDSLGVVASGETWEGSADSLEKELRDKDAHNQVDRLLSFASACGTYLGRLKRERQDRVSSRVLHGATVWTIIGTKRH